jgi:hypothetical protein
MKNIQGIKVSMFADNIVTWPSAKSNNKQQRTMKKTMNHSLEVLNAWATENNIINKKSKTLYQFFSLQHNNTDFSLKTDDQMLQKSASSKYLLVLLDNKLNWMDHIKKTVEKTNKRLALMKRQQEQRGGSTQDILHVTYNNYVKPIMKYGSEVIDTTNNANLNHIESAQNNALRLICEAVKNTSHSPSTIHRKPANNSGNIKTSRSHFH